MPRVIPRVRKRKRERRVSVVGLGCEEDPVQSLLALEMGQRREPGPWVAPTGQKIGNEFSPGASRKERSPADSLILAQ